VVKAYLPLKEEKKRRCWGGIMEKKKSDGGWGGAAATRGCSSLKKTYCHSKRKEKKLVGTSWGTRKYFVPPVMECIQNVQLVESAYQKEDGRGVDSNLREKDVEPWGHVPVPVFRRRLSEKHFPPIGGEV